MNKTGHRFGKIDTGYSPPATLCVALRAGMRNAGVGLRKALSVLCLLTSVVCLLAPQTASARWILGVSDWDANQDAWESSYGVATVDNAVDAGGNPDGFGEITFDSSDTPESDIIKIDPATGIYAGSWLPDPQQGATWIEFDFYAEDVPPSQVAIMWQGEGSDYIWGQAVSVGDAVGDWTTTFSSYFDPDNYLDWMWDFNPGLSQDQFLADLGSIDWIGVWIVSGGSGADEVYGIDNFGLWIPEPSEYLLIAAAAITSALALRRRRKFAFQESF